MQNAHLDFALMVNIRVDFINNLPHQVNDEHTGMSTFARALLPIAIREHPSKTRWARIEVTS